MTTSTASLLDRVVDGFRGKPRLALLMSGEGTNADAILLQRERYPNLNFVSIVTDRRDSNAASLAEKHGLQFACIGGSVRSPERREELFERIAAYLDEQEVDFLIYAGFMKVSPKSFCERFPGINTHPADLRIIDDSGKPKYTGMHAVPDAISAGESSIASTVHVVDAEVDCGQAIAVSWPLQIKSEMDSSSVHAALKTYCEHSSFPLAIEMLSQGELMPGTLPFALERPSDHFCAQLKFEQARIHPLEWMYLAQDVSRNVGFDFTDIAEVMGKVEEEAGELLEAFAERDKDWSAFEDEIGDCFFTLINLCRHAKVDVDRILQRNCQKYQLRCEFIEGELKKEGRNWSDASSAEIYELWKGAKAYMLKEVEESTCK